MDKLNHFEKSLIYQLVTLEMPKGEGFFTKEIEDKFIEFMGEHEAIQYLYFLYTKIMTSQKTEEENV